MRDVRRSVSRFVTTAEGRETRHSFSFGSHYDPANVAFHDLLAHNEEILPAGTGYAPHRHVGVEIVTVVLSGHLSHESEVGSGVLGPGGVQRLVAGSGVTHSEVGAPSCRFVQTWLPGTPADPPSYDRVVGVTGDGLVPLAGGGGPLALGADARLWRWTGEGTWRVPRSWAHVFVVSGRLEVGDDVLGAGDALRLEEAGVVVRATGTALVWSSGA